MSPTLYIHPLCYSSYKLVKSTRPLLEEKGVELRIVDNPFTSSALHQAIVSVPFLEEEGVPLAVDPLDPGELESILETGRAAVYEPWKMLARGILASGYLTTLLIVQGREKLPQLIPRSFAEASLRTRLGGHSLEEVAGEAGFWERVWERFWDKAPLVVAYNYARHTYWALRARGEKPSPKELQRELDTTTRASLGAWVIGMSSLGRVGNPLSFSPSLGGELGEAVERALEALGGGEVAEWIAGVEQKSIEGDRGFWEALERLAGRGEV